ncbi:unnamed protein product [Amoebophrya sp. A25]|nr:unnamed protein product [Amoebophrya sp. A25]|eukprot:GSA25T00005902001.1
MDPTEKKSVKFGSASAPAPAPIRVTQAASSEEESVAAAPDAPGSENTREKAINFDDMDTPGSRSIKPQPCGQPKTLLESIAVSLGFSKDKREPGSAGSSPTAGGEMRNSPVTHLHSRLSVGGGESSESVAYTSLTGGGGSGTSQYSQSSADNIRLRRRMTSSTTKQNKLVYSQWDAYSTVSFRRELTKDVERQTKFEQGDAGQLERLWVEASSWLVPAVGGFAAAASASAIEIVVEKIFTWRVGYCATNIFATSKECCGHEITLNFECVDVAVPGAGINPDTSKPVAMRKGELVRWSDMIRGDIHKNDVNLPPPSMRAGLVVDNGAFDTDTDMLSDVLLGVSGILLALLTAILVKNVAPAAKGSGIPEIKTILGGFHMPAVLSGPTLGIKCIGLCLVVAAGMSLGKEGPLVHVSCCWAMLCSSLLPLSFSESHAKVRELLSAGAAAGVSVAFGAPLGGVLFSFEEVSTFFPNRTCSRAFFAAVVAALSLQWFDPTGTGKLTMFQVTDSKGIAFVEYIAFAVLGVIGGCVGALFVALNGRLTVIRTSDRWRSNIPIELEVAFIALFTVVLNALNPFMVPLATNVIHRLFAPCSDFLSNESNIIDLRDDLNLCDVENASPTFSYEVAFALFCAAIFRFAQVIVTFGTGIPAGLFVPSLFCGACIGRMMGMALWHVNTIVMPENVFIDPGVYAMIGAAAVLGGVCRVTISLVVIMFELTGALEHIVPFMLAVQIAKWTGDLFTEGIYDLHIRLRKYPFLHEPDGMSLRGKAEDIMDDDIDCICIEDTNTLGTMIEMLEEFPMYNGFPLVKCEFGDTGSDEWVLLGYIHSDELRENLTSILTHGGVNLHEGTPVIFQNDGRTEHPPGTIDLSDMVDDTVIRVVPDTPLFLVHTIFHKLGLRFVAVVKTGKFQGLITKKAFVRHLQHEHHGHEPTTEEEEAALRAAAEAYADEEERERATQNGNDLEEVHSQPTRKPKSYEEDHPDWAGQAAIPANLQDIVKSMPLHQHSAPKMVHLHKGHADAAARTPHDQQKDAEAGAAHDEKAEQVAAVKDVKATGSTANEMEGAKLLKSLRIGMKVAQAATKFKEQAKVRSPPVFVGASEEKYYYVVEEHDGSDDHQTSGSRRNTAAPSRGSLFFAVRRESTSPSDIEDEWISWVDPDELRFDTSAELTEWRRNSRESARGSGVRHSIVSGMRQGGSATNPSSGRLSTTSGTSPGTSYARRNLAARRTKLGLPRRGTHRGFGTPELSRSTSFSSVGGSQIGGCILQQAQVPALNKGNSQPQSILMKPLLEKEALVETAEERARKRYE